MYVHVGTCMCVHMYTCAYVHVYTCACVLVCVWCVCVECSVCVLCVFFVYYPLKLACSLLFTIPKKGNLKLPSNFRSIQMLPTLGVLYDRILTKRLDRWLNVHDKQSGFRKGKSTLTQIFTFRLLIEMAKNTNTTLYIGCFDIQKAFDKVSRLLLFKKLC